MGYYLLNTDGGMVNDGHREHDDVPGEAAIAVLLKQVKNGKEHAVESFSRPIGPATNDVAEYVALIEGLKTTLAQADASHVRAFMDSEFIVEQVNERAEVGQDDLEPLLAEVHALRDQFTPKTGFRLSWIPREQNREADELVREVLYPNSNPS